jgi:hypothetical protein
MRRGIVSVKHAIVGCSTSQHRKGMKVTRKRLQRPPQLYQRMHNPTDMGLPGMYRRRYEASSGATSMHCAVDGAGSVNSDTFMTASVCAGRIGRRCAYLWESALVREMSVSGHRHHCGYCWTRRPSRIATQVMSYSQAALFGVAQTKSKSLQPRIFIVEIVSGSGCYCKMRRAWYPKGYSPWAWRTCHSPSCSTQPLCPRTVQQMPSGNSRRACSSLTSRGKEVLQ